MTDAGYIEVIGGIAGILSSVSLFPQVARCWRRRCADDISFGWLIMGVAAVSLWVVYGVLIDHLAVVLANSTVGLSLLIIAFIKLRWGAGIK